MLINAEFLGGETVKTVGEFDVSFENSQVMEISKDKLFREILILKNSLSEKEMRVNAEFWEKNLKLLLNFYNDLNENLNFWKN